MNSFEEEDLFQLAAEELESGQIRKGLWIKALTEVSGDERAAKANYIKLRVDQFKQIQSDVKKQELKVAAASLGSKLAPFIAWAGLLWVIWVGLVLIYYESARYYVPAEEYFRLALLGVGGWLLSGLCNLIFFGKFTLHPWEQK